MGLIEAMLEAVKLRLRPILMTSIAFVLGAVPRVISSDAGSADQNAISTGVAGRMISGTEFAVFLLPLFYVVVRGLTARPNRANHSELHAITAVDIGHA